MRSAADAKACVDGNLDDVRAGLDSEWAATSTTLSADERLEVGVPLALYDYSGKARTLWGASSTLPTQFVVPIAIDGDVRAEVTIARGAIECAESMEIGHPATTIQAASDAQSILELELGDDVQVRTVDYAWRLFVVGRASDGRQGIVVARIGSGSSSDSVSVMKYYEGDDAIRVLGAVTR